MDDLRILKNREKFEKLVVESKGSYYFYQLDDETNSYLDPLWMKVLLREYGSYTNLPLKISSKVLEIEEYKMTEAVRTKNKPISHLPIASEFKFLEIDLSDLVSYKTYEHFEKQIRNRENMRHRRIAQEKRYNEKAKLIDEKKYEYYLRTNIQVNMHRKTKLVPEWVSNKEQEDQTWFTLDGKEIKSDKKSFKPWDAPENEPNNIEESKEVEENKENEEIDNDDNNLWNDFKLTPQKDEFPVLGGGPKRNEKVPVIYSKKQQKPATKAKKNIKVMKYKDDLGNEREIDLTGVDTEFIDTGDHDNFTLQQFIVPSSQQRRNKRKEKRKR